MKENLLKFKNYFDTLFQEVDKNIMLDEEQRKAVLMDEPYNMIVAGAGSGKTTTMAAKVKYLVDIKKVNPKNIVMISFTNKSVEELKQRIQNKLHIPCLIYTFHKFGLVLLNKEKKIISDSYTFVLDFFEEEFCKNNHLLKTISYYFPKFFFLPKFYFLCKSLNQYYQYKKIYCHLFSKEIEEKGIYYRPFIQLCMQFIQKIKSKNINIQKIVPKDKKEIIFMELITRLYIYYQKKLKKNNAMDFDDIIIQATEQITHKILHYQYIIVDEYQDISLQRFLFIKKVCEVSDAKLTVVGDDFQTIYSFSGSQIELFTDFEKSVGKCSVLKITNTYRNSQQLIDIAGKFVMRNHQQIKKQLVSSKSLAYPICIVLYHDADRIKKLYFCIQDIVQKYGEEEEILLLGRYHFDIHFYLGKEFQLIGNRVYVTSIPNLKITFLSIHSAKGLGFDQVILLNVNDELYGFPSKVESDSIMELVEKPNHSLLEERRLFYVAITRTKYQVYILSHKNKISPFVLEIMKEKEVVVYK